VPRLRSVNVKKIGKNKSAKITTTKKHCDINTSAKITTTKKHDDD
jgi:hypothetical protein